VSAKDKANTVAGQEASVKRQKTEMGGKEQTAKKSAGDHQRISSERHGKEGSAKTQSHERHSKEQGAKNERNQERGKVATAKTQETAAKRDSNNWRAKEAHAKATEKQAKAALAKAKQPERLLSRGKPTHQSSVGYGGPASRAVDGNHRMDWGGRSCTHTHRNHNAWWRVDLGTNARVNTVKVWNRSDCCGNRLNGYQVRVGNHGDPRRNGMCGGNHGIHQGQSKTVSCGGKTGRFVGIVLPRHDYLTLCEVEVRGHG